MSATIVTEDNFIVAETDRSFSVIQIIDENQYTL